MLHLSHSVCCVVLSVTNLLVLKKKKKNKYDKETQELEKLALFFPSFVPILKKFRVYLFIILEYLCPEISKAITT